MLFRSFFAVCAVFLCSCTPIQQAGLALAPESVVNEETHAGRRLKALPPPQRKAVVAVYGFKDKTGQYKPTSTITEYSRAVTQGGGDILIKALLDAGNKSWFRTVEREGLDELAQERKIIRMMRDQYAGSNGRKLPSVGPMLYAGILLQGGITAYESNVLTGGLGARYLGIGANSEYRRDVVTVNLRAVSVTTGEVLASVNASKAIYSMGLSAGIFKFVAFDKLLEAETGLTYNEPPQLAVRQAIETAVYALVIEGAKEGLWNFADPEKGRQAIQEFTKNHGTDKKLRTASAPLQSAPLKAAPPANRR